MKIVFVHGWGFTPDLWQPIQENLVSHELISIDLGYFGSPPSPISSLPDKALYIGHSLGVMWILNHAANKLSGLISINGFDCFYRYVPKKVLQKMEKGIERDSELQLNAFYSQCSAIKITIPSPPDRDNLLKGLSDLSNLDLRQKKMSQKRPISVLASCNDLIVPETMTQKIWDTSNITWSRSGGHLLPLTQPEWCSLHIKDFIAKL